MSLDHVEPVLFIAGLARVAVWFAIAALGYRQRRIVPLTYGALAGLTSVVFAINNAHGYAASTFLDISTFLAFPIAMLILIGVMVTRPTLPAPKPRGWSL